MSTIPASQLVAINPSVLTAGGSSLKAIGLMLTNSTRVPLGTVPAFADAASVASYFGAGSTEDTLADIYFNGWTKASKLPGSLLFAQYNEAAVAAYLRSGDVSAYTVAQLQAISGSLVIAVDGDTRSAGSVNLSAATGFSSAAGIVQTALNAAVPTEATFTGSVGAVYTASISTTVMTVSAVSQGIIRVGDTISGTGVTAATTIISLGSGTGGTGTYNVSVSQTAGSTTITSVNNVLNVTAVATGTLAVGQTVTGGSLAAGTKITAFGTGTGGTGTYILSGAQQQTNSGSLTAVSTSVTVTYDSTSGGFVVTSGLTGALSTIAFATGTISDDLKMTAATGAVLSQGAPAASPGTFMDALVLVTTKWVTFMTTFDPDGGSGNSVKKAFSVWKNTQNQKYGYVCADADPAPAASNDAATSLGKLLPALSDSGTSLIWSTTYATAAEFAAFQCGAAASIDFDETGGRITFAYKAGENLVGTVVDGTTAQNLLANGYNFYGAYGTAADDFVFFQDGRCTGDFRWFDSYVNQIWLNDAFQVALLNTFENANSIPFTPEGYAQIAASLQDPITAGLAFKAFAPGDVTNAQAAQINSVAGSGAANAVRQNGYFLKITPASPTVRAARGPVNGKFYYLDNGSIQTIDLSSIAVQ